MQIIRSCDIHDLDVTRLNEQFDLWLIDDPIDDDEGFIKHCYYVARRHGKMMDWEVLSPRVGSSYTSWDEAKTLAAPFVAEHIMKRLEETK